MKKLLLSLVMLISVKTFGCSCGITPCLEKYQRSEFIPTAKILKVVADTKNKDYHDIEIKLIEVYKGKPVTKLKIISVLNNSCSFFTSENSTWLIFASKDSNGFLSFGYCSGSQQVDRQFNPVQFPNLDTKYKKSIDVKLEALGFLKKNKIFAVNKFNLVTNDYSICKDSLKGFKEKIRFAVYELEVNQDLTIQKIKILQEFDNKELSEKLTDCVQNDLRINSRSIKAIPEKTNLIVIYFYYQAEGKDQSFVTTWDL
jgi:hypothetical protein